MPYQTATVYFAVIELVAAVGLWLATPWGAVVWLTAIVSMAVVELMFPAIYGGGLVVIGLELLLLAAYLEGDGLSYGRLRKALKRQTRQGRAHPVFLGSAITGAGVDDLMAAIITLLPATEGDAEAPVSGTVFKVERGPAGEKIAYARLFSGALHVRDRLAFKVMG